MPNFGSRTRVSTYTADWMATGDTVVFEATGGTEIKSVGGYKYHLFDASGTFSINRSTSVDIAVIGAGGGGGAYIAGAGGGGAKEPASGYTTQILNGSYTVTVAAGGAGSVNCGYKGGTPSDTSFFGTSTIAAKGGGGGGSQCDTSGDSGGSGGGGSGIISAPGGAAFGSNTNPGGYGSGWFTWASPAGFYRSGAGGGATGAGQNGHSGGSSGGWRWCCWWSGYVTYNHRPKSDL